MEDQEPSRTLREYFCLPPGYPALTPSASLSGDQGYFRFGSKVICFGQSSSGTRQASAEGTLYDTFPDARVESQALHLPFDLAAVIENLRLERYRESESSAFERALKLVYYGLRPHLGLALREQIQRFHHRNWEKISFPRWPVDTTVDDLCETILALSLEAQSVERVPFVWFWPRGAKGCIVMTHDVETSAGRDFCPRLMDLDDAYGVKAAFQLVPEDRYEVPVELRAEMHRRGFEVAIQDLNHDGRLFDDRKEFLRRAPRINRYAREYGARGFRAAVLYRKPEWFPALDFSFDMSIPNVAHLDPQRGGCCTVMPYFIGEILELPVTTTQDYMLFHLLKSKSIDLWRAQIWIILKKYGLVSFIVHPDYLQEAGQRAVYEELLQYLRELRRQTALWFALPREVDDWWRARRRMAVVMVSGAWRVQGEGAENAIVAFAKNENGQLVYDLADGATAN